MVLPVTSLNPAETAGWQGAAHRLRDRGLGLHGIASRRRERIFGETGTGRSKYLSTGIKLEQLGAEYDPRNDTCLRAFVRMLAETAEGMQDGRDEMQMLRCERYTDMREHEYCREMYIL